MRSAFWTYGGGRKRTRSTIANMVALAPTPTAIVTTTAAAKLGLRTRER